MMRLDAAVSYDMKKALHSWRADYNNSRLAAHDAADVYITVGGAFTIDDRCSTMHEEESPARD